MDNVQTMENSGILKQTYEESPQLEALRRKQKKLEEKTKGEEYGMETK